MNFKDNLNELKERQQQILKDYDEVLLNYKKEEDLWLQNELLEKQLIAANEKLVVMHKEYETIAAENLQLKISLKEQMLDERLNIIRLSQEKLSTYFYSADKVCQNHLIALEKECHNQISTLKSTTLQHLAKEHHDFLTELTKWEQTLTEKIQTYRHHFTLQAGEIKTQQQHKFQQLADMELSDATVQQRVQQNETEMRIGLSWINKIGILLILFGVGAAAKYVHSTFFNDYLRGASFFVLGSLFLLGGEYMYRKGKSAFANGLLGGGVAILYCAVFYSYFLMEIISIYTGLFVSVLITILTVVLAIRYHAEAICALGLVGGYLPFFTFIVSFGLSSDAIPMAMLYLSLLNLSVLAISTRQKWTSLNYLSMVFHAPSLIYIISYTDNIFIGMIYTIFTFTTLLLAQFIYPLKFGIAMKKVDLVFTALNTFFSCSILYKLLNQGDLSSYNGLLALLFCLIYGTLANFISKKIPAERTAGLIFYITSLTFAILMIPFQLGFQWLSIGWLVEGTLFIIYGLKNRLHRLEQVGWLIFILCLCSFYIINFSFIPTDYFYFKFTAITVGSILITATYLKNQFFIHGRLGIIVNNFKYFTIINTWFYLQFIALKLYSMDGWNDLSLFYEMVITAIINIGFAYGLLRIPQLCQKPIRLISFALYSLSLFIGLIINLFLPVISKNTLLPAGEYFAIAILITFNVLLFATFRELLCIIINQKRLHIEIYPLGMIVYLTLTIVAILTQQFHLGSGHFTSSLILLAAALASLIYGFKKNFVYTRRFGLGLSILSTTKLFLFDLIFLDAFNKIIAYFIFGFVLLGISYLYQRLKNSAEAPSHDKKM